MCPHDNLHMHTSLIIYCTYILHPFKDIAEAAASSAASKKLRPEKANKGLCLPFTVDFEPGIGRRLIASRDIGARSSQIQFLASLWMSDFIDFESTFQMKGVNVGSLNPTSD